MIWFNIILLELWNIVIRCVFDLYCVNECKDKIFLCGMNFVVD